MSSSQPDHFLLTSQPENARESVETIDTAFSSAQLPPYRHLETGDKHTERGQNWHAALVSRADNQVPDAPGEKKSFSLHSKLNSVQCSSVQSLSHVQLFATL